MPLRFLLTKCTAPTAPHTTPLRDCCDKMTNYEKWDQWNADEESEKVAAREDTEQLEQSAAKDEKKLLAQLGKMEVQTKQVAEAFRSQASVDALKAKGVMRNRRKREPPPVIPTASTAATDTTDRTSENELSTSVRQSQEVCIRVFVCCFSLLMYMTVWGQISYRSLTIILCLFVVIAYFACSLRSNILLLPRPTPLQRRETTKQDQEQMWKRVAARHAPLLLALQWTPCRSRPPWRPSAAPCLWWWRRTPLSRSSCRW